MLICVSVMACGTFMSGMQNYQRRLHPLDKLPNLYKILFLEPLAKTSYWSIFRLKFNYSNTGIKFQFRPEETSRLW